MEKVGWKNNKITISNRLYFGVKIVTLGLPFFWLTTMIHDWISHGKYCCAIM